MELKRGFVYDVIEDGRNLHPIVVLDDTLDKNGCIKGVAFTHNEEGSVDYPNEPFPKKYVITRHSKGDYKFKWNETRRGSTSIIKVGFLKSLEIVEPKAIGRITKRGLEWIEEQVKGNYEVLDGHIYNHCRNRSVSDNEIHD